MAQNGCHPGEDRQLASSLVTRAVLGYNYEWLTKNVKMVSPKKTESVKAIAISTFSGFWKMHIPASR
jgi:hypothetical protein